jgi:hypothetical protein
MADDFSSFEDDSFDDTPDWLLDDDDDDTPVANVGEGDDDEFEQLRQKSARSGSMYDEMDTEGGGQQGGGSSFSWSSFSSGQRLVLAILIVMVILAIGFFIMVIARII